MPEVKGVNGLDAWKIASRHIDCAGGQIFNLLTTIENPQFLPISWLGNYNPKEVPSGSDQIRDVINTIFPLRLGATYRSRSELYRQYLVRHDRSQNYRRNRGVWGTYFERLIRMGDPPKNQLEEVISKLRDWNVRATAALVLHPSSPIIDSPRKRGGPCWHFGEFVWHSDGTVDLVAVYRNHDFLNKALGNFIGLGQLLNFVCGNSGKRVGKLICHSVHAYHAGSKKDFRTLVNLP